MILHLVVGGTILVLLVLTAVLVAILGRYGEEDAGHSVIHHSGSYSIIHSSPRLRVVRPRHPAAGPAGQGSSEGDFPLREYGDLYGRWTANLEANIATVEKGDEAGIQFYRFDFDSHDTVCARYITPGAYVTREQIFHFPHLVPPFHLGCTCMLRAIDACSRGLPESVARNLHPFMTGRTPPRLPRWSDNGLGGNAAAGFEDEHEAGVTVVA